MLSKEVKGSIPLKTHEFFRCLWDNFFNCPDECEDPFLDLDLLPRKTNVRLTYFRSSYDFSNQLISTAERPGAKDEARIYNSPFYG